MIKAYELRIGNILYDTIGTVGSVVISGGQFVLSTEDRGYVSLQECAPIPLTPEWLERCGFKDGWLEFNGGDQLTVHKDGTATISGWDSATSGQSVEVPCKYLHQLQNLYFALTGEELNVKL